MQDSPVNYTDIPLLLSKIHQRLASLESKVDMLVSRGLPARVAETKPFPAPVQKPSQVNPGNAGRQGNRNRNKDRMMYKIICADCKKECEIPFRPREDRPVYCRECFARRKAGNSVRAGIDAGPKETPPAHINPPDEKQVSEKEKIVAKKAPVTRKKIVAKKKIKALKVLKKKKAR